MGAPVVSKKVMPTVEEQASIALPIPDDGGEVAVRNLLEQSKPKLLAAVTVGLISSRT